MAVRTEEKGGGVTPNVQPDTPVLRSRVVLLIHGYCNNLEDARKSYATFIENFKAFEPKEQLRAQSFVGDMVRFYWPGDKDWWRLRFLSYSLEIRPAKSSAKVLAEFFSNLKAPVELYVIAHSLGNRVAMELLDSFWHDGVPPAVRLRGVCMMAAAVPVSAVRWPGNLHYASLLTQTQVLFSPGDWTLRVPFPAGQAFGIDSFASQAVGLNGEPLMHWKWKQPMAYTKKGKTKKYGHGDYWIQKESAKPVSDLLKGETSTSLAKHALPSNSLAPPNELATRRI
ncbi:MAG: alpha/beta hydrolase [Acidobacteriia bacterium]|nr:alpha/beta hydrolase [Terriglobia bacterium]